MLSAWFFLSDKSSLRFGAVVTTRLSPCHGGRSSWALTTALHWEPQPWRLQTLVRKSQHVLVPEQTGGQK